VAGQWGYKSETTVGTAVVVDEFLPILSENIKNNIQRLESMGIRAGRLTTAKWKAARSELSGTVNTELWNTDVATLLNHVFGAVATATNGGQWDYTFTPGDLTGQSFTSQVGRPDIGGTVRPFTWAGCKVSSWSLGANEGEIAQLALNVVAMSETNGTALAVASYDADLSPFVFTEGSVTIGGAAADTVKSFSLAGDNGLVSRFRMGSATSREYLENALRVYNGTMALDFEDLTEYDRYLDADEFAVVLTFDNGTETLVITLNARYDGESPALSGVELLEQPLAFKAISTTSDASAVTAVLTNAEGLTGAA
jgi:hypothetical protein